ncbi:MAG: hypothetical protein KAS72_01215 [Phycisphaerales bacterium]|nr:hypothetical protein [Phycisphaerales bacterium]
MSDILRLARHRARIGEDVRQRTAMLAMVRMVRVVGVVGVGWLLGGTKIPDSCVPFIAAAQGAMIQTRRHGHGVS